VNQDELPIEQWWNEEDDASLLPGGLFQFLRHLLGFITKYDTWLLQPHDIVLGHIERIEEDIHQLHFHCEGINSKLGHSVCIQGLDFPDIWSAVDFLASTISEIDGKVALAPEMTTLVEKLNVALDSIKSLQTLQTRCQALEDSVLKFDGRFKFIHPILLSFNELSNTVQGVLTRLSHLEDRPMSSSNYTSSDPWTHQLGSSANRAPLPDPFPHVPNLNANLAPDADARIRTLEHAVKSMEKRIVGDGIRIKKICFKAKRTCVS
jgi:hypothetical protein